MTTQMTAADEFDGTGTPWAEAEFDRSDWDRLYGHFDPVIMTALARQRIQPADREDCRQEIWIELLASRMSGFRGGSVSAWLATLARNKSIDMIRRARRHPVGFASGELEGTAVVPTESCSAEEALAVVRAALAQLEEQIEHRSFLVFVLRCIEGLSFGRIADVVNLTPEQARARHHRTKDKFRRIVKKYDVRGQARG